MKKLIISTLLILVLGLIFVACDGDSEDSNESGGIYGHVTDFATGEDVAHANVTLSPGGNTTLTGSDGIYEFRDLTSRDYTITVSKEGYNKFDSGYPKIDVSDKMVVYDVQLVKYKACEQQPCGSHGTCVAESDYDYDCICDEGYYNEYDGGERCVNPCDPNPCGNGICTAENSRYYNCSCDVGYWDGSQCDEFPECSSTNTTPCKYNGYIWSARSLQNLDWNSSVAYCESLTEGGYDDWTLPSVDVLMKLGRSYTNAFGEKDAYWSSSSCDSVNKVKYFSFSSFTSGCVDFSQTYSVRCVR